MYRLTEFPTTIIRMDDNSSIPFDFGNNDYKDYLKWLSEGNEPLPADEPSEG